MNPREGNSCPDCYSPLRYTHTSAVEDYWGEDIEVDVFHCDGCDQIWDSNELRHAAFRENNTEDSV